MTRDFKITSKRVRGPSNEVKLQSVWVLRPFICNNIFTKAVLKQKKEEASLPPPEYS